MSDPLSTIAGIIGVVQGIHGCWKFYSGVKGAKEDVDKLTVEIDNIKGLVEQVKTFLNDTNYDGLSDSRELKGALEGCRNELQQLQGKLDSQKDRGSRLGFFKRTKWPFVKPDIVEIINSLERWKASIDLVLTVYQTDKLQNLDQKIDLAGLPIAEGAAYGSFADRHEPECLPGTRIELRKRIADWLNSPHGQGECLFWLSGVAGTGKSTISRTIARDLKDNGQLVASFFFRRGEKDRGNAARLFTTLASQFANKAGDVRRTIQKAIEADPSIPTMNPGEQFSKLIFQPLSQVQDHKLQSHPRKVIVVIDALDECDQEKDQRLIISLLSQFKDLKGIDTRVFLTSRPELPIRLGFKDLSKNIHQDVILHEVAGTDRDIGILLQDEFSKIRQDRGLPSGWPGDETIQKLIKMAVPLFIFAATACRFIADEDWDPEEQVKLVMEYQTDLGEDVEKTYLPILKRLITDHNSVAQAKLAKEFRQIVGAIVNLASPLSIPSLAKLLSISEGTIDLRLKRLHSVLNIPAETSRHEPVRTFHLSFRDFLTNQRLHDRSELSQFWVDEKEAHRLLATHCIEIMSSTTGSGLKRDICGLGLSGILRSQVDVGLVQKHISPELQYACRYWVYHIVQSGGSISENDQAHNFLQKNLLHWLEAESLLGEMDHTISKINELRMSVNVNHGQSLWDLLYDIKRFVLRNRYMIDKAPLQTYISALIFAPEQSLVKKLFDPRSYIPWLRQLPQVEGNWDAVLQTLEGHEVEIASLEFYHDILASMSFDGAIRLWDANTGAPLRAMKIDEERYPDHRFGLSFSPNGVLASQAGNTIKLWDIDTGALLRTLRQRSSRFTSITFAFDGALAAASDDCTIGLWGADTGALIRILGEYETPASALAFFDGILASISMDGVIRLHGSNISTSVQILDSPKSNSPPWVEGYLAFSPVGILGSVCVDGNIRLWDSRNGTLLSTIQRENTRISIPRVIAFFGDILACATKDGMIELWNGNGALLQTVRAYTDSVRDIKFSSSGILASASSLDATIKLRDIHMLLLNIKTSEINKGGFDSMRFSSNGELLASSLGSASRTVCLWEAEGALRQKIAPICSNVYSVAVLGFSTHCDVLALTGRLTPDLLDREDCFGIELWGLDGVLLREIEIPDTVKAAASAIAFSSDDKIMAATCLTGRWTDRKLVILLWGLDTEAPPRVFRSSVPLLESGEVVRLAFSSDNKALLGVLQTGEVLLWDSNTGKQLAKYELPAAVFRFASDPLNLWDALTLEYIKSFNSKRAEYVGLADRTSTSFETSLKGCIVVKDEWMWRDEDRIVWLLDEYRPASPRSWDICGNRVALGHRSGRVALFEFDQR
ncbi:hypothetical protein TWF481_010630 [Arthrobotrys musiformis]|uniref:Mitochondrial division protein 1 n=1 Tax=Arthrobotrys musiformis TaxID=47236 RepID=A0AAV9W2Q7_9PEZI